MKKTRTRCCKLHRYMFGTVQAFAILCKRAKQAETIYRLFSQDFACIRCGTNWRFDPELQKILTQYQVSTSYSPYID